jgi:hypothetical protein
MEQKGQQYVEMCLRFELELESTAVAEQMGASFETRVTSKVPLRATVEGYAVTIEGEGPAYNESYEVTVPDCDATTSRGGGTFRVLRVNFDIPPYDLMKDVGAVRDMRIDYDPGTTSESFSLNCQGFPVQGPGVLWSELFVVAHKDDIGTERLVAQGWAMLGDEHFARKEWEKTASMEGGTIAEIGSFNLYHRPGQ